VPGAELSLKGDVINLGGCLSAADRQALSDRLRGIFGAQATIGSLGDATAAAVQDANDKALSALRAIDRTSLDKIAHLEAVLQEVVASSRRRRPAS
jgi:hypothetical protein